MLIRDVIEIPERVHKGDFVLKLTEGVEHTKATLDDYVVTEQLAKCFDRALGLIQGALAGCSSKAAYLHGSFGSGKSHFMAVLHALLRGDADARSIPELAGVVGKHSQWLEGKKLLLVPFHMIGAPSMEVRILGGYVDHVRRHFPDTRPPGVFLSDKLFEDAKGMRAKLGEQEFFTHLNEPAAGAGSGWGDLAAGWDSESFEAALRSPAGSESNARLVGDLVSTYFKAYAEIAAGGGAAFVNLDDGLSLICKHAKGLGFHGVVFFLDELILWLASRMADQEFVSREGPKLAKLVESGTADRPVPLVSFVARQRDLSELVGQHVPGASQLSFADVLKWWEGRFDRVTLEDRNLPAIARRRILKPRSEKAAGELARAFEQTAGAREEVMRVLLTSEGDRDQFRDIYPFSPAFVQALIALSSMLQRERTALKVMLQLLVNQRETLQLGDLVPVGDLYDVIAEGDEPFSEEMRRQFENAKQLYHRKLLPLLEQEHGVRLEQLSNSAPEHAKVRAFRTDDRLVKTLLLSALVPDVEAFRDLTAARLAALNHGTIRTPIPGNEGSAVLTRVRKWAAQVGEIRVGEEAANPTITVQLSGVDTEGILEAGRTVDNTGNRQAKVREVLFRQIGLQAQDTLFHRHEFVWRGTRRLMDVLFGNLRDRDRLPDSSLVSQEDVWKVVFDFPFDDPGHGPSDDLARLEAFRVNNRPTRTVCCVPSFLSLQAQAGLGKLVILDHILVGNRWEDATRHLRAVDRQAARTLLENQQRELREQLVQVLEAAYGVAPAREGMLDKTHSLAQHFVSLDPSFAPRPPIGAHLREAFVHLMGQMLESQFPAHPQFGCDEVKPAVLRKVLDQVRAALEQPDGRVIVDKPLRSMMKEIAQPLKLGEMHDGPFVLGHHWKEHFERKLAAEPGPLTVAKLRAWTDEPHPMGLPPEVQDLLILVFAEQTSRSFHLHGGPVAVTLGRIPDDVELREQPLPPAEDYRVACERAAKVLGLTVSPLRNASNVSELVAQSRQKAADLRGPASSLVRELETRMKALGLDAAGTNRMKTARASLALLESLHAASDGAMATVWAKASLTTSAEAMAHSITKAEVVLQALKSANWALFETALTLGGVHATSVDPLRQRLTDGLTKDEYAVGLAAVLESAEREATRLLGQAASAQPTGGPPGGSGGKPAPRNAGVEPPPTPVPHKQDPPRASPGVKLVEQGEEPCLDLDQARQLFRTLQGKLESDADNRIALTWTLLRRERQP